MYQADLPQRIAFLEHQRRNLDHLLVKPLKDYVVRMIQQESKSQSIPDSVRNAPDFLSLLAAWDKEIRPYSWIGPMTPIALAEIERLMKFHDGRPPVADELDLDAADLPSEIWRYTRTEIAKVMCCLTPAGRTKIRRTNLSDAPSSPALVWAILRGVDDRNWAKRATSQTDEDGDFVML